MPATSTPSLLPLTRLLAATEASARSVGALLRKNLARPKKVAETTQHDIKLELDSRSQRLITRDLRRALPEAAVLGEEGTVGDLSSPLRWVLDPIDGTVNFTYGIPHACISIALQRETNLGQDLKGAAYEDGYETVLGLIYDPFTNEMWTALADGSARLNGRKIKVATDRRLDEAIIALGFAKKEESLQRMLPVFQRLIPKVRKIRIMGAAALSMTYVATGRFDGYVESGVRLWDIAAGGLILQRAGGVFWRREISADRTYEIVISSPALQRPLHQLNSNLS